MDRAVDSLLIIPCVALFSYDNSIEKFERLIV